MAKLRTESGYSQRDLTKEMGIPQRMIADYEKETKHPPTQLLPLFAESLGVATDQLLGIEPTGEKQKNEG